jgi:hypothetical protein
MLATSVLERRPRMTPRAASLRKREVAAEPIEFGQRGIASRCRFAVSCQRTLKPLMHPLCPPQRTNPDHRDRPRLHLAPDASVIVRIAREQMQRTATLLRQGVSAFVHPHKRPLFRTPSTAPQHADDARERTPQHLLASDWVGVPRRRRRTRNRHAARARYRSGTAPTTPPAGSGR